MVFAWLIPIAGCALCFLGHENLFCQLLRGGVIWLTLGSLFQGVLEIYGTTNHLNRLFFLVGGIQLAAAVEYACFRKVFRV